MLIVMSIFAGVVAYELHKRKSHALAIGFDISAVALIIFSWR